MSFKPEEKDWMAYLYDELEGEEKQRMELYLVEHPEARQELARFQSVRNVLNSVEDQEVIAPPIFIGETRQRSLWSSPALKVVLSIAASLILVILVARFTGLRMDVSNNEFRLGFGEPPAKVIENSRPLTENTQAGITPEEVQRMINSALQQNNNSLQTNWKESQAKFDASIRKNLATNTERIDGLMQQAAMTSQDQVREYIASLQAENMNQVKDYFQLTSNEQKKYMENLLVDFAQYLQQQRNNDLQIVQSQMQSLEQNTNIFKKETEQILTGIISSVRSNENPAETKN